jgi:hypothetical protein
VGSGVAAVAAAVMAGLGISAGRMVAFGVVEVGPQLVLPALPRSPLLLYSRAKENRSKEALNALAAAFKGTARS